MRTFWYVVLSILGVVSFAIILNALGGLFWGDPIAKLILRGATTSFVFWGVVGSLCLWLGVRGLRKQRSKRG